MSRFNQRDFLHAIERFGITETAMPPPLIVRFLGLHPSHVTALKSIELVWSGVSNVFFSDHWQLINRPSLGCSTFRIYSRSRIAHALT